MKNMMQILHESEYFLRIFLDHTAGDTAGYDSYTGLLYKCKGKWTGPGNGGFSSFLLRRNGAKVWESFGF